MIDIRAEQSAVAEKPLVTFALFAYNQEKYIREAVESAFAQTYEPLEIILSDDCSTDRTFEIMQEMSAAYHGPHLVVLNRNHVNLGSRGLGLHVNRVIEMSHGQLIVFAAGDDISFCHRVAKLTATWEKAGFPDGSIHSALESISDKGEQSGTIVNGKADFGQQSIQECIRNGATGVFGASHAITRTIYDFFGPLPEGTVFEDRTLAFRSLLRGKVIYLNEALVQYRQTEQNISGHQNFMNETRWLRWIEGIKINYQSFLEDYKLFTPTEKQDIRVLLEIEKGLKRADRSRALSSPSRLSRAIASFHYSAGLNIYDRINFVLQRIISTDGILYQNISTIWRAWSYFVKFFRSR